MKYKELRQLGLELKRERETRNITLETIYTQTKINISFLKSIEAGQFNFLPNPYVRYFLKAYLQKLGGSTEHYLKKYDDITKTPKNSDITDEDLLKSKIQNAKPNYWLLFLDKIKNLKEKHLPILAAGTFILILIIIILLFNKKDENLSIANNQTNMVATNQDSQLASFSSFLSSKKKLNLNLIAKEKTWLQIAIDDSVAHEYVFDKGDTEIWHAKGKFLLRIGNAVGVRLYLNGNDLGILGKKREAINLLLTKDGIQPHKF